MNPEEYQRLARIDRVHWFYRAKRAVVRHWIGRHLTLGPDDLLIDAGMGAGTWLVEMGRHCRILGLDDHEESLALARPRVQAAGGRVIKTGLNRVGLADGCAAVVTLMDVLEHLDDDAGALAEMVRLTRPGGLIVITVPALKWLWSDWDRALHHRRRYARAELLALVKRPGVEILRCAFFNTALLPAIALVRAWRKLRPEAQGAERAEDRVPPWPVNALLEWLTAAPACVGPCRPPWGVSLLAVLRRAASGRARTGAAP